MLTFESVTEVAQQLEREGTAVGARGIHAILQTGSLTTIQKYLLRWREEKARNQSRNPDLPETVSQGILAFVEERVEKTRKALEREHLETKTALLESIREGEENEKMLGALNLQVRERDETLDQTNERIRTIEVRLSESREREKREREQEHTLRESLVRAELRLEELPRLREEIVLLRRDLAEEKEARVQAEKESAVSRALLAQGTRKKTPGRS